MKIILLLVLILFTTSIFAQNRDLTIILLRHAEKDISKGADKIDPDLTAQGRERAERLVETIKKYKPTQIFSSNFKRTRFTVTPLAEKINPRYRLQIQIYDSYELEDFAAQLLKIQRGTIVVAGHNSTTPMLANLLLKKDKYGALAETEYNKIWIIKIKSNKIRDMVIEY
jgi:2,3-bisphosphoglycerate-dependent phosphoglycerate mutase